MTKFDPESDPNWEYYKSDYWGGHTVEGQGEDHCCYNFDSDDELDFEDIDRVTLTRTCTECDQMEKLYWRKIN